MKAATQITKEAVYVDFCAGCSGEVLHWYEQAGMNQALAPMASDPLVQGKEGDRYVVCPHCGAENSAVALPAIGDYGPREAIVALRPASPVRCQFPFA
jgi:DNA-directed RNA polymerase subunit RPC12/RpoP